MFRAAIALLILTLVASPAAAQQEEGKKNPGPLASLAAVHQQLDAGFAAFLAGKPLAEAYKPWKVQEGQRLPKLKADLEAAGVKRARSYGFELEFTFSKAGKQVYYLRTYVVQQAGKQVFMGFIGRKGPGPVGQPVDLAGQAKPFGDAAKAVLALIKNQERDKLPFADEQGVKQVLVNEQVYKGALKMLSRSRKALAATLAQIAALEHDAVTVRLDDTTYLALSADGKPAGMIRGGFRLRKDEVRFELSFFRKYPAPKGAGGGGEPK